MEMFSVTSILFLILDPPRGQIDFPLRVLGDEFLEDLPVVFVVGFQAGLRGRCPFVFNEEKGDILICFPGRKRSSKQKQQQEEGSSGGKERGVDRRSVMFTCPTL